MDVILVREGRSSTTTPQFGGGIRGFRVESTWWTKPTAAASLRLPFMVELDDPLLKLGMRGGRGGTGVRTLPLHPC